MLLRRELAVSGSRAPIYSTIINLSPFRDSESDHALHRVTESKRRKHTWNTTRGSRDPTAYGTWHHPRSPPDPAPSVPLPKYLHRRPSASGGTSKSGIAKSSIRGLQSMVAGRAPFAEQTSGVRSSPKPSTARFINHASSKTPVRKRRLIMALRDFRDHNNRLNADCQTLKRLMNDAEESYVPGSSTRILFRDLRDELVFSLHTLSCLLEQIRALYNLWHSKTCPSRNRREANALVAETGRRKTLRTVYLTTVWQEVRDSRNQILSYARLIDSYHQRRKMPGRIDGILTRIDPLYSSIDAAGYAFVYPHQISPNAQLFELLQSVVATKRKLRAISRFFRVFGHYKTLLAPYAHHFLENADALNAFLDKLEAHLIRLSELVHRRTTTSKTDDPALQNGSSVSLPAQGNKGNSSSPVKRLLPTIGPKRPHSQVGAASKVLSHTPGISRPQSTTCLAPTAPDLGRNALSHQSCRQSYPELSQIHKDILADKRIISFGLLHSLLVGRQSHDVLRVGIPQYRLPVYPRLGGEAIHDFRVGLPKLGFQNVTSASKPRVAAFHTSAATRRPLFTDGTALGNEQPLEEETDQVSRSNDASDAQAGSLIGYCIPEVRMRECLQAPRTARSAYWQYTLYEGPKAEKVKVHYCKSLETSERIAKRFLNERVIGFDIEWKPQATAKEGIRKNVAVMQLASEDRIAIFHLARFSKGDSIDELVAPSFRRIMESASITKVGVSIKSDCTRVRKFLGINSRGLFELSHLYKLVKYAANDVKKINKMLVSLATQTEQHLLLPMYKDESVRSSDWSEELNYEQIY
ncbi:MAG: hypothetical protein Q9173_006573, partial [Seirophora scorigena]